jgi:dinuclear metal center YbgI/SA1388 family protein
MLKIKDIISYLESIAPPTYQESYDNAGLITGIGEADLKGILCCLDTTEAVIREAVQKGCNLVVAHHPIVFRGLKKLNGRNYVEKTVIQAIKHDIAIYAIHTNLDNVYYRGVNSSIAEKLGLKNTRVLSPKKELKKLSVFVSAAEVESLRTALLEAGAGSVNGFDRISYATLGVGTTRKTAFAQMKLEVVYPSGYQGAVLSALDTHTQNAHYEIVSLENQSFDIGAGLIGELQEAVQEADFLKNLKKVMKTGCIRHTQLREKPIQKVALCGGAGSFLLFHAIAQKADVFITGDFKYHEFFDADSQLVIADIGHFESEQFTIDLLCEIISEKFPTFAPLKTTVNTNPVFYL